ncbi:MAG: hypothetical protein KAG61_00310 [Bacteriovoracaceae bacterium]|nr:hypothetical protein [Bacteriovoracaceae bacterium]
MIKNVFSFLQNYSRHNVWVDRIFSVLIIVSIVIIYFKERLLYLTNNSLSEDELHMMHFVSVDFWKFAYEFVILDSVHILYYLLMKFYGFFFPLLDDFYLRLPSVLIGLLTVFLVYYFIRKRIGETIAGFSTIVLIFNNQFFFTSTYSKPYILLSFLIALHLVQIFYLFIESSSYNNLPQYLRRRTHLSVTTFLISITHPLSFFYFAALFVSLILFRKIKALKNQNRLSLAIDITTVISYIIFMANQFLMATSGETVLDTLNYHTPYDYLKEWYQGVLGPLKKLALGIEFTNTNEFGSLLLLATCLIAIASAVTLSRGRYKRDVTFLLFNLTILSSGTSFFFFESYFFAPIFSAKYLHTLAIPALFVLAWTLYLLSRSIFNFSECRICSYVAKIAIASTLWYNYNYFNIAPSTEAPGNEIKHFTKKIWQKKILRANEMVHCISFDIDGPTFFDFYFKMYFKKFKCVYLPLENLSEKFIIFRDGDLDSNEINLTNQYIETNLRPKYELLMKEGRYSLWKYLVFPTTK